MVDCHWGLIKLKVRISWVFRSLFTETKLQSQVFHSLKKIYQFCFASKRYKRERQYVEKAFQFLKKDLSKNLLLKWFCDVNKLQLPRFFVINPKRLCFLNTFDTLWYFFTNYHDRCIDCTEHFYRGKWPSNRGKLVRCVWPNLPEIMYLSMLCWRGGGGGGGGRAWGGDLFVAWGRAFEWSCSPRGEDIWILEVFDCRLGRKRLRPNICFRLPRFPHTPYGLERSGMSGFHYFVFTFHLF